MRSIILSIAILFCSFNKCYSQRHIEVYTNIQGTWDKTKSPERAQFGGNNNILNRYFSEFYKIFLDIGMQKKKPISTTTELTFRVHMNDIDSIEFVQSSGLWEIDSAMVAILRSTLGKWRPGKVDNVPQNENVKIWIHVFSGDTKGRPLYVCKNEADTFFKNGEFQKAIAAYDEMIYYNALNTYAIVQKGLALIKLNKLSDACLLWRNFEKYDTLEVSDMLKGNCE